MADGSFTPDEVRSLLRECVTVVKPGEILVLRVTDLTPSQMHEYQQALTYWAEDNAPGVKILVVHAEDGQIVRPEAGSSWIPATPDGLPPETYPQWRRNEIRRRERGDG